MQHSVNIAFWMKKDIFVVFLYRPCSFVAYVVYSLFNDAVSTSVFMKGFTTTRLVHVSKNYVHVFLMYTRMTFNSVLRGS
jgi:hypothetical protein